MKSTFSTFLKKQPEKVPRQHRGLPIADIAHCKCADVAAVFGVTVQAVAAWPCPKNPDGTYSVRDVVQWRISRLEQESDAETKATGKDNKELRRLRRYQADIKEMEVATLRGELVRSADVDREWGQLLSRLRMRLTRIHTVVVAAIPPEVANVVAPVVEREIKAALDAVIKDYKLGDVVEPSA